MPVFKSHQALPPRPSIIVLFGDPGLCKTSLANTCDTPILLDFDKGIQRSIGRKDTMIPESWDEVIREERAGLFKGYKTVIIDTAKACLDDFLMTFVITQDYNLGVNKLRAYGEIGDRFKVFLNNRRQESSDIVIIAHSKKDEDTKKHIPDVTGQSYSLLMRVADQVGYITMKNGKRMLSFDPTDLVTGKNVARIEPMEIPDVAAPEWQNFGATIVKKVGDAMANMDEAQREAVKMSERYTEEITSVTDENITDLYLILPVIEELPDHLSRPLTIVVGDRFKAKIEATKTIEELTLALADVNGLPEYLSKGLKHIINRVATERNWVYSKANNRFEGSPWKQGEKSEPAATTTPEPTDATTGQEKAIVDPTTGGEPAATVAGDGPDIQGEIGLCKTPEDIATLFHRYEKDFDTNKQLFDLLQARKGAIESAKGVGGSKSRVKKEGAHE